MADVIESEVDGRPPWPDNWVHLNRWAYAAVENGRIVAVAYWSPSDLGMLIDPDDAENPGGEPRVLEPGYHLTRADDPVTARGFVHGPEPEGPWEPVLFWEAAKAFLEWDD